MTSIPVYSGSVSPEKQKEIWGDSGYRVFISHKADVKKEVANLKAILSNYGISCFVAHEDITPCAEWAQTIEDALFSADACLAILTKGYKESDWCDHEIGCSYGRRIPVYPVKMDLTPYGLIGKLQAISCTWNDIVKKLLPVLFRDAKAIDGFISAIEECASYEWGNTLSEVFPYIVSPSEEQINKMLLAWALNGQASGSFGFNGSRPYTYGSGLAHFMVKWAPQRFQNEEAVEDEKDRLYREKYNR